MMRNHPVKSILLTAAVAFGAFGMTVANSPVASAYSGCVIEVGNLVYVGGQYPYQQSASVHCAYLAPSQDPRQYGEWVRDLVDCKNLAGTVGDPWHHYSPQVWTANQLSTYTCMGEYPRVNFVTDQHGTGGCCP